MCTKCFFKCLEIEIPFYNEQNLKKTRISWVYLCQKLFEKVKSNEENEEKKSYFSKSGISFISR